MVVVRASAKGCFTTHDTTDTTDTTDTFTPKIRAYGCPFEGVLFPTTLIWHISTHPLCYFRAPTDTYNISPTTTNPTLAYIALLKNEAAEPIGIKRTLI
jgi:hypothetical protein